ncbi:MAG: glycosyltransferase [Thiobacillaceae bacterium]
MNRLGVNVVGRIDGKTGIAQHTTSFLNCLKGDFDLNFLDTRPQTSDHRFIPAGVRTVTSYDDSLQNADVSIFVDVTSDDENDDNWAKVPVTRRKYIYSVFDSTLIPRRWSDIINNHFDAVFVPSHFLLEVYRASGVQKPVFHLPLALDLDPYLRLPYKESKGDPFVFTFVGSREKRKNVELLIEIFNETFKRDMGVMLRIHCAMDFYNDPHYGDRVTRHCPNIHFTKGILDEDAYLTLVAETDCFISLSKGEGYSIVPRQFLAAGKPVLLSDCFAHSEILAGLSALGENLGFGVDASIPVPGEYIHIERGAIFGLQYDVYGPSASRMMAKVYEQRKLLSGLDQIRLRRQWATQCDLRTLAPLYKSIIQPAFCRMSTGNELEFGGITTSDANLASRLTGRNFSLSGWQEIMPDPKKIVVIGNDGGFFSVFNRFVSYLTWTLSEHPQSVVLPDWRIDAMQRHWNIKTFTSFCYGLPADGNIWLKLFKPLPYPDVPDTAYNQDDLLYQNAILKDDYNEQNEPWLTYIHPYKLYRSPGFKRWRHWYHLYFSTYVRLQDHIQHKIDAIYDRYLKGYRVISAHIRHPSHGIEQPGARMPTVDLFCDFIREIQAREGLTELNSRIFLATDQGSVVEQLRQQFGEMVIFSADAARTTKADDEHFENLSAKQQMREGFQIQHLTAADPSRWTTKMAEDVIVDTYLLAKGHHFIHVTSNIATTVSFINPNINMIYCE